MSETYQKIKSEIIVAMKAKDANKLLALRSLDSLIKNISINNCHRDGPTEEDTLHGLAQAVKRGSDSAEQFRTAGRLDLLETELFQVAIARSFLPTQLDRNDLKNYIVCDLQDYSTVNGQLTQKDFGKLMKQSGEKYKGKTDNKMISEIIKELFNENGVK